VAGMSMFDLILKSSFPKKKVIAEHRFAAPDRKWQIDYAFPDERLAVEIEGGGWAGGRHVSGAGFHKDMEKYNALALHGYRLLRFTPKQRDTGEAVTIIREYFNQRDLESGRGIPADTP